MSATKPLYLAFICGCAVTVSEWRAVSWQCQGAAQRWSRGAERSSCTVLITIQQVPYWSRGIHHRSAPTVLITNQQLIKPLSVTNRRLPCWSPISRYALSNKNQPAWNFVRPAPVVTSLRVTISLFSRKSNGQWLVGCKFMGRYSIQSYRACGISQFGSSSYTYADRVLTRVSQSVPRERPGSTDLSRLPLQRWPYWHNKSCPAGTLQISSLSLIFVWPRIVSMILWLQPKRCNYF